MKKASLWLLRSCAGSGARSMAWKPWRLRSRRIVGWSTWSNDSYRNPLRATPERRPYSPGKKTQRASTRNVSTTLRHLPWVFSIEPRMSESRQGDAGPPWSPARLREPQLSGRPVGRSRSRSGTGAILRGLPACLRKFGGTLVDTYFEEELGLYRTQYAPCFT